MDADAFISSELRREVEAIAHEYHEALWAARSPFHPDAEGYLGWQEGIMLLDSILTERGYYLDVVTGVASEGQTRACAYSRSQGGDVVWLRVAGRVDRLAVPSGLVPLVMPTLLSAVTTFGRIIPGDLEEGFMDHL